MKTLAIFVSGSGSDMQAIIDAIDAGEINAKIAIVVASKPGIFALERAKKAGIESVVFEKRNFKSNEEMDESIKDVLIKYNINFVVLAGYLNILTKPLIESFNKKIINIHPSLIPKHCGMGFYGMRVHEAVINSKDKFSGATVHFVDENADTGEIIMQEKVCVLEDDTPQTLQKRVLELEHKLLPKAIKLLCK